MLKELSNAELIALFKNAVLELPGGGAHARSFYYDVEEAILERMKEAE